MTLTAYDECKVHGHAGPNANPRQQHLCSRCGRALDPDEMQRDVEQERRWTADAATFAQYVADADRAAAALSAFRERRMGEGPWRDVSQRSWRTEALEEVADLSAYLLAAMTALKQEERNDEDADRDQMLLFMALSAAVTAFDALRAVEQL
jgi:hypothetical protein